MKKLLALLLVLGGFAHVEAKKTGPFSEMEEGFIKMMSSLQKMSSELDARSMPAKGISQITLVQAEDLDEDDNDDEEEGSAPQANPNNLLCIPSFEDFTPDSGPSSALGPEAYSVSDDGKITIQFKGLECPSSSSGEVKKEILINHKNLNPKYSETINLCQIKESADGYNRFISVSALPKNPDSQATEFEVDARLSKYKGNGTKKAASNSSRNLSRITLSIPEGFKLEAKDAKIASDSLLIELVAEK